MLAAGEDDNERAETKAERKSEGAVAGCALAMTAALRLQQRDYSLRVFAHLLAESISVARMLRLTGRVSASASASATARGRSGDSGDVHYHYRGFLRALLTLALRRCIATVACDVRAASANESAAGSSSDAGSVDLLLTLQETREFQAAVVVVQVQVQDEDEGALSLHPQAECKLEQGRKFFSSSPSHAPAPPQGAVIVPVVMAGNASISKPPTFVLTVWDDDRRQWEPIPCPHWQGLTG